MIAYWYLVLHVPNPEMPQHQEGKVGVLGRVLSLGAHPPPALAVNQLHGVVHLHRGVLIAGAGLLTDSSAPVSLSPAHSIALAAVQLESGITSAAVRGTVATNTRHRRRGMNKAR